MGEGLPGLETGVDGLYWAGFVDAVLPVAGSSVYPCCCGPGLCRFGCDRSVGSFKVESVWREGRVKWWVFGGLLLQRQR